MSSKFIRFLILNLLIALPLVSGAAPATPAAPKVQSAPTRTSTTAPSKPRSSLHEWRFLGELGFALTPHSHWVTGHWQHQALESPAFKFSAVYIFKTYIGVDFVFSPDLVFLRSTQRISSSKASTTLVGQYFYFGGSAGLLWRPPALGGAWSFSGYLGAPFIRLYEDTRLQSPGFTSDSIETSTGLTLLWAGIKVGYAFSDTWEGNLSWFTVNASNCAMFGVSYAL